MHRHSEPSLKFGVAYAKDNMNSTTIPSKAHFKNDEETLQNNGSIVQIRAV